jgi:hypothetical protein
MRAVDCLGITVDGRLYREGGATRLHGKHV